MDETSVTLKLVGALTWIDFAILAAAVGILFVIAYFSGRKEKDTQDYFLGSRKVPTIIACLSFVATEVSAVTIMGNPATGFTENWQYLQFFIGSAAARILVAFLFIPVFYKYNCTTIYEFLKHRFGPETQYAGSIFFLLTRLVGSSVRLYAACLGVSIILGWPLTQSLILFTLISIVFIGFGGIKAVVWTGAYETLVFFLAGGAVAVYLLSQIHGGLTEVHHIAGPAGKLSIFNFNLDLNNPTTFWAGTANAFFICLAIFGTDQELMQRLLTVETRRSSQKAIISTMLAALPLTILYLSLGTLLFVFYHQHPNLPLPKESKEILSWFVLHSLPTGFKGLILAAIILASIDSPLSSLSSSFVTDIYRPLINKTASEKHYLWISRLGVIAFGLILASLAYACQPVKNVLWFAFQVVSVTGGSTLGIFLLGLLTKRVSNKANIAAMLTSAIAMGILLYLSITKQIPLAWSWIIVIGTILTFILGYILGPLMDKEDL
ncbi:MAG: sodium/solute symporter [Phycisphaerae bacterium]